LTSNNWTKKIIFPRLPSQEDMLLLAGDGDTGRPAQRVLQAQLLGL
jgi:hypothetical protein